MCLKHLLGSYKGHEDIRNQEIAVIGIEAFVESFGNFSNFWNEEIAMECTICLVHRKLLFYLTEVFGLERLNSIEI